MRFTGRIRFDDVREADLDVEVEVVGPHVRFYSGEESLGSWCLADVVANRLLANEFEIDLDGEVVVFLADDPINFAYGAVQQMAEGWARFHSMNLVRRKRAVATARRDNDPSRIDEVRRAFVAAKGELAKVTPAASPEEAEPEPAMVEPEEAPVEPAPTGGFWSKVEAATAQDEAAQDEVADQPEPVREEEQAPVAEEPPLPAGRLPRLNALPRKHLRRPIDEREEDVSEVVEPVEPPATDPEVVAAQVEPEEPVLEAPEEQAPVEAVVEDEPQVEIAVEEEAGVEPETPAEPEAPEGQEESAAVEEDSEVELETPAQPEEPDEPAIAAAAASTNGKHPRRGPAPVGAFGDGHHPAETSGLRASMRSVFSRSRAAPHEHTFVESTTAAGITRRVCLECGHVSIGVKN